MRYANTHKEDTRNKLLASSRAIAKRGGFTSTGVDALMGSIGLSGGAFYSHFPSKQALFEAIIDAEISNSTDMLAGNEDSPDKAQAIAQFALAGGGDADKGRATTPLPYSAMTSLGESMEEEQRKLDAMEQQQTQLLSQVRDQIAALPLADPHLSGATPEREAQEEKRKQLLKLLAEIERRIVEENARPKKRFVSPATREAVYAIYYDNLRRRVEDEGTANFPEAAGQKIYGELTMIVTINHDGQLLSTEIRESSGNRTLDRRAEAIVRSAAPFGRFNNEMRKKADQIAVVSRFKFNRDETLRTKLQQ